MKKLAIILAIALILGATGYRVVRIRLEPRVVAAYQRGRPNGIGRVTWAEKRIRKDIRDVVDRYEQRQFFDSYVSDVNEIAR